MKSLLSNVQNIELSTTPFPYIVIHEPLTDEFCLQLISEYPAIATITKGVNYASNKQFNYSACDVFRNQDVSLLWQEFVQTHISPAFFRQVISLFAEQIRSLYPTLELDVGALDTLTSGVRKLDKFPSTDVLLDARICLNTPVVGQPCAVRTAHVDLPNRLFSGLFYLRHPEDTSTGGDLELYRFKDRPNGFKGIFVNERYIEAVKTVKYRRNVLVLFLNSIYSLHGVTVRSVTNSPRYFFNFIGEVAQPLFDLFPYQERDWLSQSIVALATTPPSPPKRLKRGTNQAKD